MLSDAVDQVRERLAVAPTHEEEARIRRDRERGFAQAEMCEVHDVPQGLTTHS